MDEPPRYLYATVIAISGDLVKWRLRAAIRDKPIVSASPWQNAFAEEFIG